MNTKFQKLFQKIERDYDNSDRSHDFNHVERVFFKAREIALAEGANLDILAPAAILHDIINLPKNHPDRLAASRQAAEKAELILKDFDYTKAECEQIARVIIEHSYSLGLRPSSLESAILQDADRLDAIGAIGIMRTITCGSRMGASYYCAHEPIADTRPLDDRLYVIDHFSKKLFHLEIGMNTETARSEARLRTAFMKAFLDQLISEIPTKK